MRVVIPPGAVEQPTRVNCRCQQDYHPAKRKLAMCQVPTSHQDGLPPALHGEGGPRQQSGRDLATWRTLSSSCSHRDPPLCLNCQRRKRDSERFAHNLARWSTLFQVILRSDDGETWTEHVSDYVNSGEIYQVAMDTV